MNFKGYFEREGRLFIGGSLTFSLLSNRHYLPRWVKFATKGSSIRRLTKKQHNRVGRGDKTKPPVLNRSTNPRGFAPSKFPGEWKKNILWENLISGEPLYPFDDVLHDVSVTKFAIENQILGIFLAVLFLIVFLLFYRGRSTSIRSMMFKGVFWL